MEEGWLCRKYDATITLCDGSSIPWPGQACDRAYKHDCSGDGYEKAFFGTLKLFPLPMRILIILVFASPIAFGIPLICQ